MCIDISILLYAVRLSGSTSSWHIRIFIGLNIVEEGINSALLNLLFYVLGVTLNECL